MLHSSLCEIPLSLLLSLPCGKKVVSLHLPVFNFHSSPVQNPQARNQPCSIYQQRWFFFLIARRYFIIWIYTYIYILSPADGWWHCFQFVAVIKNSWLTYFLTKPWVVVMQVDCILRNTALRLKTDAWKGQVNFQSHTAQKTQTSKGRFKSSWSSFLHGPPRQSSVKRWPKTFWTKVELFQDGVRGRPCKPVIHFHYQLLHNKTSLTVAYTTVISYDPVSGLGGSFVGLTWALSWGCIQLAGPLHAGLSGMAGTGGLLSLWSFILQESGPDIPTQQRQYSKGKNCNAQALRRSPLAFCLLMSTGQKQVTWLSSGSVWEEICPRDWCYSLDPWFIWGQ